MRAHVVSRRVGLGMVRIAAMFLPLALACCVSKGYEGQLGNTSSHHEMEATRTALRNVAVLEEVPEGYTQLPTTISVRRCHRSFIEQEPTKEAIIIDLKVAAYAAGADAISDIETETLNGLLANCWWVLQGTANVWQRANS